MARLKWMVARVPKPVKRSVKLKLRYLTELLGWSTIDPIQDTTLILTSVADIAHRMVAGARQEIIAEIRERADVLRRSDDHDDLVAAAELDDLAADLEGPLDEESDEESDARIP